MAELLMTSQVARLSGLTTEGVRAAERRGDLRAIRAGSVRLFERKEVERFLKDRARGERPRKTTATSKTSPTVP